MQRKRTMTRATKTTKDQSMNRILKVFSSGEKQDELARNYSVIERYPAFVLIDVPAKTAKEMARTHLTEDMTSQYRIETSTGVIDTTKAKIRRADKAQKRAAAGDVKPLSSGPHHYLVQFVGPVKRSWLKEVEKTGSELREPYGGFTYIVRANARQIAAAAALTVEFFSAGDLKAALPAVKKIGFKLLAKDPGARVIVIQSSSAGARRRKQIDALSAVHGVRKVRDRAIKRTANDVAAGIMGTAATMAHPGLGLSGKGEIIGIADTGIDSGDKATVHLDFRNRIKSIMSYPITPDFVPYIHHPGADDGAADFDSGHGTHVSGSVLGHGATLNG